MLHPQPPGPDFNVYDVVERPDTAQVLFSIYVGDHPQVAGYGDAVEFQGALKGCTLKRENAKGLVSRDVWLELLVTIGSRVVHAWPRVPLGG